MIDFSFRALKHPLDYVGVLRLHRLTLLRQEKHSEQIYSFVFAKPENLTWKAGQHGVFWFFDRTVTGKKWRAFSIASSAHEQEIRITTIIPELHSSFKDKLLHLQPGDHLWMQGPFGEWHTTKKTKKIIGIAGGIGITPFRALLYEVAHGHIPHTNVSLIYSAQESYTFKDELEQWEQHQNINVVYTKTPEEVRDALDASIDTHKNEASYFMSGSPGMITALKRQCREKGIKKIVSDPFKGY